MDQQGDLVGTAAEAAARGRPILDPPRNCWRIATAARLAFLIDGAAYFRALKDALLRARHRIFIVGWDFDSGIRLVPDADEPAAEPPLGTLLRELAEAHPGLHIHVLVWNFSVLYGPSGLVSALLAPAWHGGHERIAVRFDDTLPFGAAHHQKIVCIDDSLAFVGGLDLTAERWDLPSHPAEHPARRTPSGGSYGPVHDLQAAFDGAAARAIAELVRQRWLDATGEAVPPLQGRADRWPRGLAPALHRVPLGIVRTLPERTGRPAVREGEALFADALAAARRWIYIEAQYLTADVIIHGLTERLLDPDGPEVVILLTRRCAGWLEQLAMGTNRDRLLRRLKLNDRSDRLRVYYPVAGADGPEILVHAKLTIADGRFLRLGSANLNNRSMGMDSECDIAIEAKDAAAEAALTGLRDRLLAEHLDCTPAEVAAAVARSGSLIAAVEALNVRPRGLRAYDIDCTGDDSPFVAELLDPAEPISLDYLWRRFGAG